jgi:hypothetical protein
MKQLRWITIITAAALAVVASQPSAFAAGPVPVTTSVALTASIGESLSISATPASATVATGAGVYGQPITITTAWNIDHSSSYSIEADAGFASATNAMADGVQVPSSTLFSQSTSTATGGDGGTNCTQTLPNAVGIGAGAGCSKLFLLTAQNLSGNATSTIALTFGGAVTAAGNYTGTINFSLEVF